MTRVKCDHGVGIQLWCTECGEVPIADEPSEYSKGYAAAVADVVAWLMSRKYGACSREIEAGAHVGAAKKGAT